MFHAGGKRAALTQSMRMIYIYYGSLVLALTVEVLPQLGA